MASLWDRFAVRLCLAQRTEACISWNTCNVEIRCLASHGRTLQAKAVDLNSLATSWSLAPKTAAPHQGLLGGYQYCVIVTSSTPCCLQKHATALIVAQHTRKVATSFAAGAMVAPTQAYKAWAGKLHAGRDSNAQHVHVMTGRPQHSSTPRWPPFDALIPLNPLTVMCYSQCRWAWCWPWCLS